MGGGVPAADSIVVSIVAVATALGGKEAVGWALSRWRTPAEAQADAATVVKSRADAADVLTGAAGRMVDQQDKRIERLDARIAQLEERDRARDDLAARHAPWDRQMADRLQDLLEVLSDLLAGRRVTPARIRELETPIGDPPPLYVPPTDPAAPGSTAAQ
jgi:hypothetical protein